MSNTLTISTRHFAIALALLLAVATLAAVTLGATAGATGQPTLVAPNCPSCGHVGPAVA